LIVIVFILIFAMTGKNTMENSKKANGMQKYRLYKYTHLPSVGFVCKNWNLMSNHLMWGAAETQFFFLQERDGQGN
jgi:hypothetical protein